MVKLTNVTSLTGNGLRDWLVQRTTSVVMTFYILFIVGFFILNAPLQFLAWQALFANMWVKVFSVIFLLSLVWHAWIGMWTIATDYLKPLAVRLLFQTAVIFVLIAYFVWGIAILWSV